MQSLISKVLMPLTLLYFPPLTWTWITSLDIVHAFHLSLPRPHSYHHIPYVICVKIQCVLYIPLTWLDVDPSKIVAWHAFLLFHSWYLSFFIMGW
jgi:hypothetical protein